MNGWQYFPGAEPLPPMICYALHICKIASFSSVHKQRDKTNIQKHDEQKIKDKHLWGLEVQNQDSGLWTHEFRDNAIFLKSKISY